MRPTRVGESELALRLPQKIHKNYSQGAARRLSASYNFVALPPVCSLTASLTQTPVGTGIQEGNAANESLHPMAPIAAGIG
jgi:hypothetical protein